MFLAIAVVVLAGRAAAALYVNKQTYAREGRAAQDEVNFAAHKAATQLDRLEQMQADAGVAFEVDGSLEVEPPSDLGIMLYRIAMEALTNVSKHANATRIQVRIASKDRGCLISIHDDGVGFQVLEDGSIPGHLGLTAMQERAEIAGGRCKITGEPGAGTTVEFWARIVEEARDLARSA
jgi:signal transduction histidine kinase